MLASENYPLARMRKVDGKLDASAADVVLIGDETHGHQRDLPATGSAEGESDGLLALYQRLWAGREPRGMGGGPGARPESRLMRGRATHCATIRR